MNLTPLATWTYGAIQKYPRFSAANTGARLLRIGAGSRTFFAPYRHYTAAVTHIAFTCEVAGTITP